jgi:PKD repeat protein
MTLIAELDHEQDPAVVVTLYDYGADTVPPHMTAPAFVDVTDEDPRPEPGYIYDGEAFAPGAPQQQEAVRQQAASNALAAVDANADFLALASPTPEQVIAQVTILTQHVNALTRVQLSRVAPGQYPIEGLPGFPATLPPVPPDVEPSPPVASFTFTPADPQKGDQIQFDASASTAGSTPITRYDWSFGDTAAPDAGPTPTYTFTKFGDYDVTLTLTDEDGLTDQATQTITI